MRNTFYRILTYLCILVFLAYWTGLFICAMPSNYARSIISNKAPRFKSIFGGTWKLFTPPNTYNVRLYFIVRDIARPVNSDTIEVIENMSVQKQYYAPFNQKENIIDHLVTTSVLGILSAVWFNKNMPTGNEARKTDSLYIANAMLAANYSNKYAAGLATLENYGKVIMKQHTIDTTGKEIKITITKIMIRPFMQKSDASYGQKEILVFETPYKPASQ